MIINEVTNETYENLKVLIKELMPEIEVRLLGDDINLYKIGLSEAIPCVIEIIATDKQIDDLKNMCIQFEVDAYNTPNGLELKETDKNYIKYQRYTWIYNILTMNIKKC